MRPDGFIEHPAEPGRWVVPLQMWAGETVFILGGGPSLIGFDGSQLQGKRVIAINNAGLDIVPFADILFWADDRWLTWNLHRLDDYRGPLKLTRNWCNIDHKRQDINIINYDKDRGLSHRNSIIGGWCSGSSCLNLAYLFGAKRIVLLGFDMKPGHYHDAHKIETVQTDYATKYIPAFEAMAGSLAARGVDVVNATPVSELKCFRFQALTDVLAS